jgi:hypothetical protein
MISGHGGGRRSGHGRGASPAMAAGGAPAMAAGGAPATAGEDLPRWEAEGEAGRRRGEERGRPTAAWLGCGAASGSGAPTTRG